MTKKQKFPIIATMAANETDMQRYELRAHMFKALSHPVRIRMLEKLKDRTWCVCELAEEVGISKSVASKYLSQLREAGLVDDEKRGTLVEYRLTAPCVLELADCAEGAVLCNRRRKLGVAAGEGSVEGSTQAL